jgi:predicted DCC family thiol-disulfide oxidoreductase YuxK
MRARPIVLFDGGCPLCNKEIAHYQRIECRRVVCWIDISREPERVRELGLSLDRVMQRFHVRDVEGEWLTGVRAFTELWSHLPYYRWLARMVRFLRLESLLEFGYGHWARWRMHRRCRDDRCGVAGE